MDRRVIIFTFCAISVLILSLFLQTTPSISQEIAFKKTLSASYSLHSHYPFLNPLGNADLDGDGMVDIIYNDRSTIENNKHSIIYGISGRSGTPLFSNGSIQGDIDKEWGASFTTGDLNGDGVAEILVSEPRTYTEGPNFQTYWGKIYGYSSVTGQQLFQFINEVPGYSFGIGNEELLPLDVNGDGRDEVLTATTDSSSLAVVLLQYSSGNLHQVCKFLPSTVQGITNSSSIHTIATLGDINSDGFKDFVLGLPYAGTTTAPHSGVAEYISGKDCGLIKVLVGNTSVSYQFGNLLSWYDLNGDGTKDVLFKFDKQKYYVVSGADGVSVFDEIDLLEVSNLSNSDPKFLPDMNGDGIKDYAVAYYDTVLAARGYINFYSGASHKLIGHITQDSIDPHDRNSGIGFYSFNKTLDFQGDGIPDLLLTSSFEDGSGGDYSNIIFLKGDCTRKAHLSVYPANNTSVLANGDTSIHSTAISCGITVPATLNAKRTGKADIPLKDDGLNGDSQPSDLTYSASVPFELNQNSLTVDGVANNESLIPVSLTETLNGKPNYKSRASTYSWISTNSATPLTELKSSPSFQSVTLPFTFIFYGAPVSNFKVGSSGLIDLDGSSEIPANTSLPSPALTGRFIAPLWSPVTVGSATRISKVVLGNAPTRQVVISWEGLMLEKESPQAEETSRIDFQIIFSENSPNIKVQYKTLYSSVPFKKNGGTSTVGLQDGSALGITHSFNSATLQEQSSVEFVMDTSNSGGGGGGDNGGNNGGGNNGGGGAITTLKLKLSAKLKSAKFTFGISVLDATSNTSVHVTDNTCRLHLYSSVVGASRTQELGVLGTLSDFNLTVKRLPLIKDPHSGVRLLTKLACQNQSVESNRVTIKGSKNGTLNPKKWLNTLKRKMKKFFM